jgi:hypothetical protein
MIAQHFYTRERRGLYKQTAGYDTIAKSPNLPDAFVIEKIHPYCTYSGGGENVFTVAHFPCGKMMLSHAAFVAEDFTRQRSTFFVHNYILPAKLADSALSSIGKLLCTNFSTKNDAPPEPLHALPFTENPREPCKIGQGTIAAIIEAIEKSKKTYILVPSQSLKNPNYVRALLDEIFVQLPAFLRHMLGFCTFAREPEKRKGIHLILLEKEAYRVGRFDDDFVIDIDSTTPPRAFSFENFPPERFFPCIDFLKTRLPALRDFFLQTETNWLEKNLEKHLCKIPPRKNPAPIFTVLYILQTISAKANKAFNLRYFLGNYSLSDTGYAKIITISRRLFSRHITPENFENIAFLFRERGTGTLDQKNLHAFIQEFAPTLETKDKFMLFCQ